MQIAQVVRVRVPGFEHQEGARRGARTWWQPVACEGAGEDLARGPTKTCAPRAGRRAAGGGVDRLVAAARASARGGECLGEEEAARQRVKSVSLNGTYNFCLGLEWAGMLPFLKKKTVSM